MNIIASKKTLRSMLLTFLGISATLIGSSIGAYLEDKNDKSYLSASLQDVNNDGIQDIVIHDRGNTTQILYGLGNGQFKNRKWILVDYDSLQTIREHKKYSDDNARKDSVDRLYRR